MSGKVIDIRTRKPRRVGEVVPITRDASQTEDRMQRAVDNLVTEAEILGVSWTRMERWFASALAKIRSKLAQKEMDL